MGNNEMVKWRNEINYAKMTKWQNGEITMVKIEQINIYADFRGTKLSFCHFVILSCRYFTFIPEHHSGQQADQSDIQANSKLECRLSLPQKL